MKISSAHIFCLCNSNVTTFPTTRKCKNLNFSLYTIPAEVLYLQKYLTNFQNLLFPEGRRRWLLWLTISSAQTFCSCNSNVNTFPSSRKCEKFQFFPLHYPNRNAISSKVLNVFLKTFSRLKEKEGGYCGCKFQVHRYFGFATATLPLFQHPEECKNFNFSLYNCPSRNAISSKVFNECSKTFFCLKDEEAVFIVVENFKCADILVSPWQRYHFSNIQKM